MLPLVYAMYIGALYVAFQNKNDFIVDIDSDYVYGNYIHAEKKHNNFRKELDLYQVIVPTTPNIENAHKDNQIADCACDCNCEELCTKPSEKRIMDNGFCTLLVLFSFIFGVVLSKLLEEWSKKYETNIKRSIDKRLQIMETDAITLINDGCHKEASVLLKAAIDIIITQKGKSHIDFGTFNHLLAKTKLNLGQLKSAEIILVDVIKMYVPYGEDSHMREALEDLGTVLQYQGRIDESVLIFSKVNEIVENIRRVNSYLASEEFNIEDIYTKYALPYKSNISDTSQPTNKDKIDGNLNSYSKINYYVASNKDSKIGLHNCDNNILMEKTSHPNRADVDLFNTPIVHDLLQTDRVEKKKKFLPTNISPETIMYEFENN